MTFGPGETTKTVAVTVTGDTAAEAAETFLLKLSAPSANAAIADTQATVTTINDD